MRIGKERCERKVYPHRVYPDRNRIRLRVNGASENVCERFGNQFGKIVSSPTIRAAKADIRFKTSSIFCSSRGAKSR